MPDNTPQLPDLSPASKAVRVIHETVNNALLCADSAPEALSILDTLSAIATKVRELKAQAEAKCIELIDRDGDYTAGGVRWYVGKEKRVKPRDRVAVLEAVLDLAGGDVAKVAEFLSAGADTFKAGAIRAAIESSGNFNAPRFDDLFETTEVMDLKEGKPKRTLKSFNPAHAV